MKLPELISNAEQLPLNEQLQLVTYLLEKIRQGCASPNPAPTCKWSNICGAAPYPLVGGDAQAWVTSGRAGVPLQHPQDVRHR